jgi:hypothetical protein
MTNQEFKNFVKSILNEYGQEIFWTDEEIEVYKKLAITTVVSKFAHLLKDRYQKYHIIDANPVSTPLPSDCFLVISVERLSDGAVLPKISHDLFFEYNRIQSNEPLAWGYINNEIMFFPAPAETISNFARLWYLPEINSLDDLPVSLHPLVALITLTYGKAKDDNFLAVLERRIDEAERAATIALIGAETIHTSYLRD